MKVLFSGFGALIDMGAESKRLAAVKFAPADAARWRTKQRMKNGAPQACGANNGAK